MKAIPEVVASDRGPTVVGASVELLTELLAQLEGELRQQGVPVDDYFQPGAAPSEVHSVFNKYGLTPPDEVVAWFGWHNGITDVKDSRFVLPQYEMYSLASTDVSRGSRKPDQIGDEDWQWDRNWIEIMGDKNGMVVCCADRPENAPLVRAIVWGESYTAAQHTDYQNVSLCAVVTQWIDAIQRGWFRWNATDCRWDETLPLDMPLWRILR